MTEEGPKKIEFEDEKLSAITKKIGDNRKFELEKEGERISELPAGSNGRVPEPPPHVVVKSLRTFQGDAAEIIKKQNTSVLSIALAEKKKQQQEIRIKPKKEANPELKKKVLTITISILLIVLGIGVVFGFYYLQKNTSETIVETPGHEKTIVSYDQKISLDVTSASRDTFLEVFSQKKRDTTLTSGEVAYIALTKKTGEIETLLWAEDLLSLLKTKAPGSVVRAFKGPFMLGLYRTDQNESFILITLSSFENAFDGMLRWENTLNDDLGALFTRKILAVTPAPLVSSGTTPSSTSTGSASRGVTQVLNLENPSKEGFTDETVKNRDARVLKNMQGNIILLYSFLDKDTLLIAGSTEVLDAMIDTINSKQQSR